MGKTTIPILNPNHSALWMVGYEVWTGVNLTHLFFLQDTSFYLRERTEPLYMEKCSAQVKPTYKIKLSYKYGILQLQASILHV